MSNHSHGLWGYSGRTHRGHELTIQATGIGGPSAAIVLGELAALGTRRAIRLGPCTAIDPGLSAGDGIVVETRSEPTGSAPCSIATRVRPRRCSGPCSRRPPGGCRRRDRERRPRGRTRACGSRRCARRGRRGGRSGDGSRARRRRTARAHVGRLCSWSRPTPVASRTPSGPTAPCSSLARSPRGRSSPRVRRHWSGAAGSAGVASDSRFGLPVCLGRGQAASELSQSVGDVVEANLDRLKSPGQRSQPLLETLDVRGRGRRSRFPIAERCADGAFAGAQRRPLARSRTASSRAAPGELAHRASPRARSPLLSSGASIFEQPRSLRSGITHPALHLLRRPLVRSRQWAGARAPIARGRPSFSGTVARSSSIANG